MKPKRKPASGAMPKAEVQRIQELRRSSASSPQGKRPTRARSKREAIVSGW
jgi:hypothetical protein